MPITNENKGYLILKKQVGTTYSAPTLTDATIPLVDSAIPEPDHGVAEYGRPANGKHSNPVFASGKLTAQGSFGALFAKQNFVAPEVPHGLLFDLSGFTETNTDPLGTEIIEWDWDQTGTCTLASGIQGNVGCDGVSGFGVIASQIGLNAASFGAESVNGLVKFTGTWMGAQEGYGNQTAIVGTLDPDLYNQEFDKFLGAVISVDGAPWKITSWNVDMGISLAPIDDPSVASGVGQMYQATFEPRLNITAQNTDGVDLVDTTVKSDGHYDAISIETTLYTYSFTNLKHASTPTNEPADGVILRSMELTFDTAKVRSKL